MYNSETVYLNLNWKKVTSLSYNSWVKQQNSTEIFGYIMLCLNNLDPTINLPSKMGKKRYWKDRSSALAKT